MKTLLVLLASSVVATTTLAFDGDPATDQSASMDHLFTAPLRGLAGDSATLAVFRGRPVVVNFWARWCGPCRDEIPSLIEARAKRSGRSGVELIGVALDDRTDAVRDFAHAYDMDYPNFVVPVRSDGGIALLRSLGNPQAALPFTLALDRHGRVVFRKIGPMSAAETEIAFDAAAGS